MNTAVLVIDLIEEFVTGRLSSKRTQGIIPNVKQLINAARLKGYKIIYLTDSHLPEIDKEFEIWGRHAETGTPGTKIVPQLSPREGDFHLEKRRYSAFYGTGLDELLRMLEVKKIIFTGVLTNICIQHTVADAYMRDYKIIIPTDCVTALTEEEQIQSIQFMKKMYGIQETTSKNLIKSMENT
jgi:nicotinamidase-related amidase